MNKKRTVVVTIILSLVTVLSMFVVYKTIPDPRSNQTNTLNRQIKTIDYQVKKTDSTSEIKGSPFANGEINLPKMEQTAQEKLTKAFTNYYGGSSNTKKLKLNAVKDQDILGKPLQNHLLNMTSLLKDDGTPYLLAKKNIKTLIGFQNVNESMLHATAIVYVEYLPTGSKTNAKHVFYLNYDLKNNQVLNYTDHDINV